MFWMGNCRSISYHRPVRKLTNGRATRSTWPAILDPDLCPTPWDTVPKVSNLPSLLAINRLVFRCARHVSAPDDLLDEVTLTRRFSLVRWRLLFLGPDRGELLRMRLRRVSTRCFHLHWPRKPDQYPMARSETPCPARPFLFVPAIRKKWCLDWRDHQHAPQLGSARFQRCGQNGRNAGFPYQLQDVPGCLPVGCFSLEEYQIAYVRWHGIVSGA